MTYAITNLDFEYAFDLYERGASDARQVPGAVIDVARRWESILRLVEPGAQILAVDAVLTGRFPKVEAGHRLITWGWTPSVVERARGLGLVVDAPELEVVQKVNSKVYSHRLESTRGWALDGARLIASVADLERGVQSIGGPWIAKHPWGVSGRRQRRQDGPRVSRGVRKWCKNITDAGQRLVLEPVVDIESEWSVHFEVDAGGEVQLCGVCRLLTGPRGTFRGIGVGDSTPSVPEAIVEGAKDAACAVAGEGYFGPVGIDAMAGTCRGREVVRPVTEINARQSFGRLALALWERLDDPSRRLVWRHPAQKASMPVDVAPWPVVPRTGRFFLPDEVDPDGRSATFVEIT